MDINNKYHNGKIYQITDIGYNKCYIGSTTESLSLRMARHRANYKSFLSGGKGSHIRLFEIFNEFGIENCKIQLVEYFKCDTLQELQRREGEVIKITDCVNKLVAGRTRKEYRDDNRDKLREIDMEYREQHKDKFNEYSKQYREANNEKINERTKQYYKANKDKINELSKQKREANKEKINERRRELRKLKKEMR